MQLRSFVGTIRQIEARADAALAVREVADTQVWTEGWSFVQTIRDFGELLRASAPLPYERGADPTVNDAVADLIDRLYGWPYLSEIDVDHPARQADRAVVIGDLTVIPLARSGPEVHNWLVLVRFLDWKLRQIIEKVQRLCDRLHRMSDKSPCAGVWESAASMVEATQTTLRYLWRRRRSVAQRVPETSDHPEMFGRWALEQITR